MAANPFEHVMDTSLIEVFPSLHMHYRLPRILGIQLTKFMVLELVAFVLILLIFPALARRVRNGEPPRGAFWNAFESLLTFIRDKVAKPTIGDHDADRYVPFLWTMFLFILFCNLLGMFPYLGSPTASLAVTVALAFCSFVAIHGSAIAKMGPGHYLQSYVPHVEAPALMQIPIVGLIVSIEILGNFIKAGVLAVRLFANMFAGHTVLAVILLFIVMAKNQHLAVFSMVTVGSVLGVTALSLLELFVAFLQAFVFTFLTALFLGSALHPQH